MQRRAGSFSQRAADYGLVEMKLLGLSAESTMPLALAPALLASPDQGGDSHKSSLPWGWREPALRSARPELAQAETQPAASGAAL